MRLVAFTAGQGPRLGAFVDDRSEGVVDLTSIDPHLTSIDDIVKQSAMARVRDLIEGVDRDMELLPVAQIRLLPPIARPSKMLFVRANYPQTSEPVPDQAFPSFFAKLPSTLVGSGADVIIPDMSSAVDFEAELAFVVGRTARNVGEEEALDHVAGYTITNDVSARDIQHDHGEQTLAKNFRTFGPMGPCLATPDEVGDPASLGIRTWVNDEELQNGSTKDMIHSVPEIIAFLSSVTDLHPGDVIATGSPPGIGFLREPPRYLKAGDSVRIEIDRIGTLTHGMIKPAESAAVLRTR